MRQLFTLTMVLASVLGIASAQAELITVTFGGTLDTVEDPNNVLDSSVFVGAPFSGTLSYDPVGAVDIDSTPDSAEYHFLNSFSSQIGDMLFSNSGFVMNVANGTTADSYGFNANFFSSNGIDDLIMNIGLVDLSATSIDSTDPLTSPIDLADFPDLRRFLLTENVGGVNVRGDLVSFAVVPEPSAIFLGWLGWLVVFSYRHP